MRIFTTSLGHDPGTLVPGRDLVLDIDLAHGDKLAEGVFAHDLLDLADRRRADALSVAALAEWRVVADQRMTADGICWSWIWEWTLHNQFFPWVHRALALRQAVERHRPSELTLMDDDPFTRDLAHAIADDVHVTVRTAPDAAAPPPRRRSPRAPLPAQADTTPPAGWRLPDRSAVGAASRQRSVPVLLAAGAAPRRHARAGGMAPGRSPGPTADRSAALAESGDAGRVRGIARSRAAAAAPGARAGSSPPRCPASTSSVDGLDLSPLFRRVLAQVIDSQAGTMALAPVLRARVRTRPHPAGAGCLRQRSRRPAGNLPGPGGRHPDAVSLPRRLLRAPDSPRPRCLR